MYGKKHFIVQPNKPLKLTATACHAGHGAPIVPDRPAA